MKTIQIHPLSLLLGVTLTALAGLTLSTQSNPLKAALPDYPFVIEHVVKVKGIPAPEDLWSLFEFNGAAVPPLSYQLLFTVPHDKRLVITQGYSSGLERIWEGSGGVPDGIKLDLPGSQVDESWFGDGYAFGPGTDLMIENPSTTAAVSPTVALLGYLADA